MNGQAIDPVTVCADDLGRVRVTIKDPGDNSRWQVDLTYDVASARVLAKRLDFMADAAERLQTFLAAKGKTP
jgi:hypothetical protein